jgi:endonuclease I
LKKHFTYLLLLLSVLLRAEIPANYYVTTDGKNKGELKTALYNIIKNANVLEYGGGEGKTWSAFPKTDMHPDSTVWDMYSNQLYHFNGINAVSGMNIEHSLPNSWWGGTKNQAYKDLHHLNPADGTANRMKSNWTMGIVNDSVTFDNGVIKKGYSTLCGTDSLRLVWEPADEYKGDFARIYMYMVTCYEQFCTQDTWIAAYTAIQFNNSTDTYPVFRDWTANMLLEWNRQDPVSVKELNRNEEVYKIQGNRNPFIDCSLLAEYIWGNKKDDIFSAGIIGTKPYISTPATGKQYPFSDVTIGKTASIDIPILGYRLTQPVKLELQGTTYGKFTLSTSSISAQNVMQGSKFTVSYYSEKLTTDTILLNITSLELADTIQLILTAKTNDTFKLLDTKITKNSFTINWNPSFDALYYKVSVFTLKNIGEKGNVVKIDEDFTSTPNLPKGWTKSSTGVDVSQYGEVKLASGSNPGSITTPSIAFLGDSATISVRAKSYNASDKSPVVIITCGNTEIASFSTSINYQTFTTKIYTKDFTNENIIFSAQAGKRIVIDSVKIVSYEGIETPVLLEDYPKTETGYSHLVDNLEEEHTYYFTVQPQGGSNTTIYGPITVYTSATGLTHTYPNLISWQKENNKIYLKNINIGDKIMLVDLSGKILYKQKTSQKEIQIPLNNTGCYILVVNSDYVKILNYN